MSLAGIQSFADLQQLNLERLEHLWDDVSTEHQTYVQQRYAQALKDKVITDDHAELALIEAYLKRYQQDGLVPAGDRWAKISASTNPTFQLDSLTPPVVQQPAPSKRSSWLVIVAVGMGLLFLLLLIPGVVARQSNNSSLLSPTPTATITLTPTPTIVPTVTPLALVDTDRFVQNSDRRRNRNYYPVVFRVVPESEPPRVFVVQEKLVNTTEWDIDPNPDVASWVSGMVVHPVLGIPFSETNQQLFNNIQTGTNLILRMNTGANLRFRVESVTDIARDDTAVFSRTTPGIAMILVGEIDIHGLPTETRRIVYGSYPIEQELDWLTTHTPVIPAEQSGRLTDNLDLTITDISLINDEGTYTLTVSFDLFSSQAQTISFMTQLEESHGLSISPSTGASPFTATLTPDVKTSLSFDFTVPTIPDSAVMLVTLTDTNVSTRFALNIPDIAIAPSAANLDLQVKSVVRTATAIEVAVRLFNQNDAAIDISAEDVWWITGYTPSPIGPKQASFTFEPLTVQPNTAHDISWQFNWNGADPYAALGLLGRQYSLTLKSNLKS